MTAPSTPGPVPRTDPYPGPGPVELDLGGRTALVTGAAGGIGRACALRLAAAGAKVRAVDRDAEGLDALAARSSGLAGAVEPQILDLTDLDAAEATAAGADILVNNAGLQLVRPIEEFPPDVFHTVLTVMLEAPFRLIRGALPHMYAQGWGRIVNISSVHGLRASAFKSAYVAAKHGLEGLSKTAALEGAPHGVTSVCVNPGYVRTPLVEKQIADQAAAHSLAEDRVLADVLLKDSAIKRLIEPEEVAEAVLYLCTPQASFITGTSLALDGGWTAH
ncbi:3-hydroxybutyrate dehydrogenase [Streptomyces lunaelactis]|uniref:3-hydroxybutyrate dehydrogenase n=1 Tax=Streptomyces lunaelactis TaxID=1535768 RepID=UPI00158591B7|nr:3-hydroxybutyrate dehydrogenase [Streptomyces lunaelactis]NUK00371.1 3-hydroxybutyrate dehydrogenase [Streptomyces lunaelactis]NUK14179.1 3-hydroxybutyrate dehydrogenase [Streptomyces lunaelactis]NUK21786.1 3-hydroxybutyrate dehydrogenase [Streptomyces lunaelactis]NUK33427.1 3-hydroxybutyrate dehydrogenase [Streptomyces lunaelactis]NUK40005.1 3-hydroxybutyrate dehydrogenase [Streptomyces lunaelactis]